MGAAAVTSGAIADASFGNSRIVGPSDVVSPGFPTFATAAVMIVRRAGPCALARTSRRRLSVHDRRWSR
jgi:hypothetical protein